MCRTASINLTQRWCAAVAYRCIFLVGTGNMSRRSCRKACCVEGMLCCWSKNRFSSLWLSYAFSGTYPSRLLIVASGGSREFNEICLQSMDATTAPPAPKTPFSPVHKVVQCPHCKCFDFANRYGVQELQLSLILCGCTHTAWILSHLSSAFRTECRGGYGGGGYSLGTFARHTDRTATHWRYIMQTACALRLASIRNCY